MNLWNASLETWIETLAQTGDRRAYLLGSGPELQISHDFLRGTADVLSAGDRDFDAHEGLFFEIGRESSHLLAAFVHKTTRGQGAGGLRYWSYETFEELTRDGLRLSRGMGHKNALAGLWWGGGKGIIARRRDVDYRDPEVRRAVFGDYG
ncbi:MAG: Glu/Leu/Phe/Val dehydrogenase dimerization domain-containing protein, partial [Acidobacteriota bacterium]